MRAASIKTVIAGAVVLAAALAFWLLLLSPKREESDKLGEQIGSLTTQVEVARSEVARATEARRTFPAAYRQLVELGQAVPSTDETPSLLIELNHLAAESHVFFESIQLENEEGIEESSAATAASSGTVSASEVEASLLPLGASIGSAGLGVMPYTLKFEGTYFNVAAFIGKVEAVIKAGNQLGVDGRLVTINSFGLSNEVAGGEGESASERATTGRSPILKATFSVTTYVTPPGQGLNEITPTSEPSTETVAAE